MAYPDDYFDADKMVVVLHELSHLIFEANDPTRSYFQEKANKEIVADPSIMHAVGFENTIRSSLGKIPRVSYHGTPVYPKGFTYTD